MENPEQRLKQVNCLLKTCVLWRHRLEASPAAVSRVKSVGGVLFNLHFVAASLLLTLPTGELWEHRLQWALAPLLLLCAEVLVGSLVVLCVNVTTLRYSTSVLSVWRREALGRLVRNAVVAMLLGVSLALAVALVDEDEYGVFFKSTGLVLLPTLILLVLAEVKFCFINTQLQWYWQIQVGLALLQCVFFILYTQALVPPAATGLPTLVVLLLVAGKWCTDFVDGVRQQTMWPALYAILGVLGCSSGIATLALWVLVRSWTFLSSITGWVCVGCLSLSTIRESGELVYDILFGHIETDYNHFLVPARLLRKLPERSPSDVLRHMSYPLLKRLP